MEPRRQRVIDILRDGTRGTATVLTAPAGFGKREAVAQWASSRRAGPVQTLRLRRDDDEPLVAARVAELDWADGGALVFDSLDLPVDPAVIDLVVRLIELAPPGRHVVITRRSAAPGPLDRILDRPDVMCVDHRDLRFDEEEVRALLARIGVEDVTDAEVEALLVRTQGWPVAVRLTAAELQRGGPRDGAIEQIRGTPPHLGDFLRCAVLDSLSARSRRFLVCTSVVAGLSGPLGDAVTGDADSGSLLAELERDGLVLRVETDEGAIWRCQPQLRDLLRWELRSSATDDEAELCGRAARWHLDEGDVAAAGDLLVQGERWDALLEVVDRHGRAMAEHGLADQVLGWLAAIPTTGAPRRRGVVLRRALLLTLVGRSEMAEQIIHDADLSSASIGERAVLDSMRASWGFVHGAPEETVRAAADVLAVVDQLDPGDVPDIFGFTSRDHLRALANIAGARSRWWVGETALSRASLLEALRHPHDHLPWQIQARAGLALLEAWSGNLRLADHHTREAWRLACSAGLEAHPSVCDVLLARAHVLRERGRLGDAEEVLDAAMSLAATYRRSQTMALLLAERALWHLAADHPGAGLEEIERLRAAGSPTLPPAVVGRVVATEMRLHLATADLRRAAAVALDEVDDAAAAGAGVQLAVQQGDLEGAAALLRSWPGGDEPRASIEHALWLAVVEFHAGQRRSARQSIATVVGEAQSEGHVRFFLDGGEPVRRLLRAYAPISRSTYVMELAGASNAGPEGELGLSSREIDVLRYLPTPLSNAEIAASLYISVNTLKTHLRSVYRKLGVTCRREAIARAEELGLA